MRSSDLFLRTLAGEATEIKPVWIMRQAGRYLPEYMKVRNSFPNFIEFYKTPEAACEVTMQPLRRFGLDAAILFSDILTLLPPLGSNLEFIPGRGPVIHNPVRDLAGAQALKEVDVEKDLWFVGDGVSTIVKSLDGRVPLIGFAGGPLTVASYMIEGGSSKELAEVKKLMFQSPEAYHMVMDKVTNLTIEYLLFQVERGAQVLTLMDSWAGFFSPQDYNTYVLPYTAKVLKGVKAKTKVPLLHYANGAATLLDQIIPESGADAFGLDWRVDLEGILNKYPDAIFQGNLDPITMFSTIKDIETKTNEIKELVKDRPHIMNLGHGVIPKTPIEGVEAFIKTIRS